MENSISAVILAGGRATRMNGEDKGLQIFQNKPLFQHIQQRLQPQITQISINANRHHAEYATTGLAVFADTLPNFQGPLSGMLTALERAETEFVLFVPCDCPFLPPNLVEKLQSAVQNKKILAAYVHDGEREHPTICLISRSLKKALNDYLARGERRILHFLREQHAVAVDFSEQPKAFVNINTLADLEQYSREPLPTCMGHL